MTAHPVTYLDQIVAAQQAGRALGIPSICSANPWVIRATLLHGLERDEPVLIESTCNQVNQFGGYTGMTPADFVEFVAEMAREVGFPRERLLLGGDHLGPNPWQEEPARQAMEKAQALVAAYTECGYTKLHLDASMRCGDDDPGRPLPTEVIARRAAALAQVAEETHRRLGLPTPPPRYVIGTEVPIPGGAQEPEEGVAVTPPAEVAETIQVTREAFLALGLHDAWERVVAVVVQPGVEFGHDTVFPYDPAQAAPLARFMESQAGLVYEAHSTDYQTVSALAALVRDHFAILKVGPALTFALREGIFALAMMEEELLPAWGRGEPSRIREVLEEAMLAHPQHWRRYYPGSEEEQCLARRYSFSDRIRYYWPAPPVQAALDQLLENLSARPIPLPLLSQFLPEQYRRIREGQLANHPQALLLDKVRAVLEEYAQACGGQG